MARVAENSRGIVIAALIVIANFVIVLQITGISYGRFIIADFGSAYDTPTSTPTETPTSTPTETPTSTPTNTPVPNGGACSDDAQCASRFCVDGVCCDTRCDQPGEFCNLPGREGICSVPAAPAPALSDAGLAAAVALLMATGVLALRRSVRRNRAAR